MRSEPGGRRTRRGSPDRTPHPRNRSDSINSPVTLRQAAEVEQRTLSALALARSGLMHFAYFFVRPRFIHAGGGRAALELLPDPAILGENDEIETGALLLTVDFAMSAALHSLPAERRRMATATFHFSFSGAPLRGPLAIEGEWLGDLAATSPMLRGRATVHADGHPVLRASGVYVRFEEGESNPALDGLRALPACPPLRPGELTVAERGVWRRTAALLRAGDERFVERLWGYAPKPGAGRANASWPLGPHVQNRYGAAHGGLLGGLAAATARAAVPGPNRLLELSVSYLSPGLGARLRASSRAVHAGRRSATVLTSIRGAGGKPVIETMSVHTRSTP